MNEFGNFYQSKISTISNRAARRNYKRLIAKRLGKSVQTIDKWIKGVTVPNRLEQKAINVIFREKIYQDEELD